MSGLPAITRCPTRIISIERDAGCFNATEETVETCGNDNCRAEGGQAALPANSTAIGKQIASHQRLRREAVVRPADRRVRQNEFSETPADANDIAFFPTGRQVL